MLSYLCRRRNQDSVGCNKVILLLINKTHCAVQYSHEDIFPLCTGEEIHNSKGA